MGGLGPPIRLKRSRRGFRESARMAARASRRPPLATLARRWFAVLLVVAIGYAYYHPLRSWLATSHELSSRQAEVGQLAAEKRALQDRLQFSASSDAPARAARRRGFIPPRE